MMKTVRRYLILLIGSLLAFFLQCTILNRIAMAGISPNLLIVLIASIGWIKGSREAMFTGFVCGILNDLFFGSIIGLYALIFLYIGYANGALRERYFEQGIRFPMIFIGLSDFTFGILEYVLFFMLKKQFHFFYYLIHLIIPEVVYSLLIAVPIYLILLHREQSKKRRRVDFFAS